MHIDTLPKTSVEVLAYLCSRLRESFTVRQIAKGIGQDYRITYEMTMRLVREKLILAEKRRPATRCRLNLKGNSTLFAYIEGVRASRFLAKHRDVEVMANGLMDRIDSPFYSMIVFGSHVKGTASRRSDLDVLFVIPSKEIEKKVSSAVGSVERISPIGIHDVTLTADEFLGLMKVEKPNVAWEAVDHRIVLYGAEPLLRMLEGAV